VAALRIVGWVLFGMTVAFWTYAELRRLRRVGNLDPSVVLLVPSFLVPLALGVAATVSGNALVTVMFFAMTLVGPCVVLKLWVEVRARRRRGSSG